MRQAFSCRLSFDGERSSNCEHVVRVVLISTATVLIDYNPKWKLLAQIGSVFPPIVCSVLNCLIAINLRTVNQEVN